jgi:hypothetical protein
MFESFGAQLIYKLIILNFYDNLVTFKSILIRNINLITEIFISVLPKSFN